MDALSELEIKEDDKYYIAFDYVVDNQDIRNKHRMLKSIVDLLEKLEEALWLKQHDNADDVVNDITNNYAAMDKTLVPKRAK